MENCRKYSKKEISEFLKNLTRKVYIYDKVYVEEFKQIKYKNVYFPYLISSFGRVFSCHYYLKEIEQRERQNKYIEVCIRLNNKKYYALVHRLVAINFLKKKNSLQNEVNHKNGIKNENTIWNLEWVTHKENVRHAFDSGLHKVLMGEQITNHKFSEKSVKKVCEMLEKNFSYKEISQKTKVSVDMVRHIHNGKSWKHITKNYDFSKYNYGKSVDNYVRLISNVNKACKMIESNEYTISTIAKECNLGYGIVIKIKNGEIYKDISKNYNINNYKNKSRNGL